jgi:hypothetical protein
MCCTTGVPIAMIPDTENDMATAISNMHSRIGIFDNPLTSTWHHFLEYQFFSGGEGLPRSESIKSAIDYILQGKRRYTSFPLLHQDFCLPHYHCQRYQFSMLANGPLILHLPPSLSLRMLFEISNKVKILLRYMPNGMD